VVSAPDERTRGRRETPEDRIVKGKPHLSARPGDIIRGKGIRGTTT
jgi:hypothetical protein